MKTIAFHFQLRISGLQPEGGEEIINKLNKFLELRSQNDFEIHVKENEKRGTRRGLNNRSYIYQVLMVSKMKYLQIYRK